MHASASQWFGAGHWHTPRERRCRSVRRHVRVDARHPPWVGGAVPPLDGADQPNPTPRRERTLRPLQQPQPRRPRAYLARPRTALPPRARSRFGSATAYSNPLETTHYIVPSTYYDMIASIIAESIIGVYRLPCPVHRDHRSIAALRRDDPAHRLQRPCQDRFNIPYDGAAHSAGVRHLEANTCRGR